MRVSAALTHTPPKVKPMPEISKPATPSSTSFARETSKDIGELAAAVEYLNRTMTANTDKNQALELKLQAQELRHAAEIAALEAKQAAREAEQERHIRELEANAKTSSASTATVTSIVIGLLAQLLAYFTKG